MVELKTIHNIDVRGKAVVLRVDFNCPTEKGKLLDTFRIDRTIPTVKHLLGKGAEKIVIISHLGRPDGAFQKDFSLAPIVRYFSEHLAEGVSLAAEATLVPHDADIKKCIEDVAKIFRGIVFLENIRFWKEEEAGDEGFAGQLAGMGEIFVNDAFSACHRAHASISGIPKYIPGYAGLLLAEEIEQIGRAVEDPARPAVAIVGGAKLETKMPVLKKLAEKYDKVLVGGLIAVELDSDAKSRAELPGEVVILPTGYVDDKKRDIDQTSAEVFAEIIKGAKTILWNGPMGKFEEKPFDYATKVVGDAVAEANKNAYTVIGGGETIEAANMAGIFDKVDFVSTGGGAMLELIGGAKLPGIEALKK